MTITSEILSRVNDGMFLEFFFKKKTDWDVELGLRDSIGLDSAWSQAIKK